MVLRNTTTGAYRVKGKILPAHQYVGQWTLACGWWELNGAVILKQFGGYY